MTAIWMGLVVLAALMGVAFLIMAYYSLLESVFPEELRASEVHTVTTKDLWKLRVCRYRRERSTGEPVLFVHGAMVNHHNFTMPKGACLIDYLAARGFDCWAVDLRGTRSSVPPFERAHADATMDDHLLFDLPAVLRHIRKTTGYDRVHWIGHSMGGMLLYAYCLEHGDGHIASAVTLGAPCGFEGVEMHVPAFVVRAVRRNPALCGRIARGAMPLAFLLRLSSRYMPTNPRNMHRDMTVGAIFNTIEDPLHRIVEELLHWMKSKTWRMKGGQLDVLAGLPTLRVPLLAVFGTQDPYTPLETAKKFFASLASQDKELLILGKAQGCEEEYNHCDLAFGRDVERVLAAPVLRWLKAHPIREHVRPEEVDIEPDAGYRPPLDASQRAGIISGDSYAHVTSAVPVEVSIPPVPWAGGPRPVQPVDEDTAVEKAPARRRGTGPRRTVPKAKRVGGKPGAKAAAQGRQRAKTPPAATTEKSGSKKAKAATKAGPLESGKAVRAAPSVAGRAASVKGKRAPGQAKAASPGKAGGKKPAPAKSKPPKAVKGVMPSAPVRKAAGGETPAAPEAKSRPSAATLNAILSASRELDRLAGK
jgi:pimeloyl-ACP methyl ester carboxylesterase